ncbi:MAG TPA: AI-2E family transporter [Terriglobales bacterium]|jgi:predicted PurR-regulated permease PerM|nr:AI-2E family transporter [Terriglobales bacterium]
MSDQVTNKSAVAEQSQVRVVEMALPSSTSPSDKLLRRIATLLFILVAGLLTVFGYYASSICITVVLAGFLAILFDPVVVKLEKLHLPRGVAAAGIVLAGMGLIGVLGHELYGRTMTFAEELPEYTSKIQQAIEPISRKIQKVQQSAGNLTNDVHATKKVPEVRLQESPSWPAYLVRGVGSVWGALIIAGVVPFLTFFMLCTKDQMVIRLNALFSSTIDTARFITNLSQMIRGFVAGNLIVGSVMAVATTLMLWGIGMKGAIPLGIASGLLNLLPFLGLIFSLALPLAAALLQFNTPGPYIVIILTILFLHVVSANLLIPKFIATRVSIGPVAATVGILFWGWLWGVMGLLLAVPLTAFVKLIADLHPSLCHLSNMLALTPRPTPRWVRYGETAVERAIPYLRGRPGKLL